MSPRCDLDLENSKQFLFCVKLWLILQHHHTNFGNKILRVQKISFGQIFATFLTFGVTLTLNAVIHFFFFSAGHSGL